MALNLKADLRSDLLKDILQAFRSERIAIPCPRREIRMAATAETSNSEITSGT